MRICFVALMLSSFGLTGCERVENLAPPQIKYGQDECAHCGMIISDERNAAALIVRSGDELQTLLFDDIGDLIDFSREHPQTQVHRRYVHDYRSRQWIDTTGAVFVRSPELHTPIGSGIVAFGDADGAQDCLRDSHGELHQNLDSLTTSAR